MATSLAQQLAKLSVPQTNILNRDKKRASLLFDQKEAATLTRSTLYQIGLDGLQELSLINVAYTKFTTTLFNESSKEFERAVETDEGNSQLNKTIRSFLHLLSPNFLQRCAHKALEWLIHRFHIHEYNRDDLIMLILPYHETNIFVRALQLVRIKGNDKWLWLKPLQKPGIHLAKSTLYTHAADNASFLKLISDYLRDITKVHTISRNLTIVFNFYCTTFTGAIENTKEVSEIQISQMLHLLKLGLQSEHVDFCAGSYIIIARLVSKTEITEKLLNFFVDSITDFKIPTLRIEAVLLLLIIYQRQINYNTISQRAFNKIAKHGWFSEIVEDIIAKGNNVESLLKVLLQEGVKYVFLENSMDSKKLIDNILTIKMDAVIPDLISILLETYDLEETYDVDLKTWLADLIKKIEDQYPDIFDDVINKLMKSTTNPTTLRKQKNFRLILEGNMTSVNWYDHFTKLHHPIPSVRKEAIDIVISRYDEYTERQQVCIKSTFIERLMDDDVDVAYQTLDSSKTVINNLVEQSVLRNILIRLLMKSYCSKSHRKLCCPLLEILCHMSNEDDTETFIAIFPFLLSNSKKEFKAAKVIINSAYKSKCKFLRDLPLDVVDDKSIRQWVLKQLNDSANLPSVEIIAKSLKNMPEFNLYTTYKFITTLLLTNALPNNCNCDVSNIILDVINEFQHDLSFVDIKEVGELTESLNHCRNGKIPLQGYLECLNILIQKTVITSDIAKLDFGIENDENRFITKLTDILIKGMFDKKSSKKSESNAKTFNLFVSKHTTDLHGKLLFLLNLAVSNSKYVNPDLKLRCVMLVEVMIIKRHAELSWSVSFQQYVLIYVLLLLKSGHKEISNVGWKIITNLVEIMKKNTISTFLQEVLCCKEEIVLDISQLPQIIVNIHNKSKKSMSNLINTLTDLVLENDTALYVKSGFLEITMLLNNIALFTKTSMTAFTILGNTTLSTESLSESETAILVNNISRVNVNTAADIKLNSSVLTFVETSLLNDRNILVCDNLKNSPSVLTMNMIDQEIFGLLLPEVQIHIIDVIISITSKSDNPEILSAAAKVFKYIDLDSSTILNILMSMQEAQSTKLNEAKKKRRLSIVPTVDILDSSNWKKGICILEFIQDKKKLTNTALIIPVLFDLLKKCLDFDEQSNVEYAKQIILSSILHCCERNEALGENNLPENTFNMGLIVQCMRASWNPQTHHYTLLLLAHSATFSPDQVLQNIMAIFTFMGTSYIRHDDAYSFQIITKIIDTIIPILIKDGTVETILTVLGVFVDAIIDVPEHRRAMLYYHFLKKINSEEYINYFLLLIFQAHIKHDSSEKQITTKNKLHKATPMRLDIAATLLREFDHKTIMVTLDYLLKYLRALPTDNNDNYKDDLIFARSRHTAKEYRHYMYTIVTFVAKMLSSEEFVNKIALLPNEEMMELEPLHKNLIVHILSYIQSTTIVAERNSKTPQADYWKAILHHSCDILDSINALLTPQMFVLVINGLMIHNINKIKRRALELLNNKLQHNDSYFNDCKNNEINSLIQPLLNIVKTVNTVDLKSDQEVIIQTALLSLKLIIKMMADKEPERFVQLLAFLTDLIKCKKLDGNILASTILCLSELCTQLKAHSISSLSSFMPALIKVIKTQRQEEMPNLLLLSAVTAIQKIFDSLALFLSPYLEKILCEITGIIAKWGTCEKNHKLTPLMTKVNLIWKQIGSTIQPRVLIPVIENTYTTLIDTERYSYIGPLMDILSENVDKFKGHELQPNMTELTSFFLKALQFRSSNVSCNDTNEIEKHVIRAFVSLILKLSETSFRPLYYKIYDWAIRCDDKTDRVITFYALSSEISNNLKGLFILFAGHFLNNASNILDQCNTVKNETLYFDDVERNMMLLEKVLGTLNGVFLYDTQKFVNKDRFEVLMQPLVDQIENQLGGIEALEKRANSVLVQCLVNFAVATGDDSLWKQLNYQVCLKMRHVEPVIRLIALECLTGIVNKIGEDFLPLLPETIPFLAELLEDEVETVEKACQKSVQQMESILGEPLQKYF